MQRPWWQAWIIAGSAFVAVSALAAPTASADARFVRAEPAAGTTVDATPFVLKSWFTQGLMSRSTIRVLDVNGAQVDLGDGRVDLDNPDRTLMLLSLPALPVGVYTVQWSTVSADDGDTDSGSFSFGVGVAPSQIWREVGHWRDSRLRVTETFTVQGPWRIRWHLDDAQDPMYLMIEQGDDVVPELITADPGATDGVINRDTGGTYSLMFHNTTPYEVVVEDFVGS